MNYLKFEEFLSSINLEAHRNSYNKVKTVELDLDKNIQALRHIYLIYWEERNFLSYEEFYKRYRKDLSEELEDFRKRKYFSKETFELGIKARIYRTWASLLTQIQAGYAAEYVVKQKAKVFMSEELDRKGIDIKVLYQEKEINIQIKKESLSREVRQRKPRSGKEIILDVWYETLPASGKYKKNNALRLPYQRWKEKWANKLKDLDNGFVVFLPSYIEKFLARDK